MAAAELRELTSETAERSCEGSKSKESLRLIRNASLSRPDLVLSLGESAAAQLRSTSAEYWDVQEQIFNAALEVGEHEIMSTVFNRIYKKFPSSWRTRLLFGKRREALCRWSDAMKTYIEVIADDPMCAQAYKRQVAVLKSQQKIPEAIALLNHYLSYYSTDAEAWAELAALSLEQSRISHALFAANELLILDPKSHASHTAVADIYMTAGGNENVLQARKHYAASLTFRKKSSNLRALYGIWLAASLLDRSPSFTAEETEHNKKVLQWATEAISDAYAPVADTGDYAFVSKVIDKPLAP